MDDITVADLLPSILHWAFEAGAKLIQLADTRWDDCSDDARAHGQLYREYNRIDADVGAAGFGPMRWIFWLRRLEEIANDARAQDKASLADMAIEIMNTKLRDLNQGTSLVRSALEANPGAVKYRDPVYESAVASL